MSDRETTPDDAERAKPEATCPPNTEEDTDGIAPRAKQRIRERTIIWLRWRSGRASASSWSAIDPGRPVMPDR
jgi:hypothetical protein